MSATALDRFARVKALQRPAGMRPAATANELRGLIPDVPSGAERLAEILGALPKRNRFGEHLALRRWFSEATGGENPEGRFDRATLRLLAPEAPDCICDPQQWLFLDTETTGVVGGTGTIAFLIGIAWWDAGGLEVEQFFMREHSEEHSALVALAERMAERRVLVTFNGKSFDWPLLETRYRMTRKIRVPAPRAHLDFLHPARNLWRLRIGSARLPELERHVLQWNRGTDVMSELIPQIYFDYLRGGSPEPLARSKTRMPGGFEQKIGGLAALQRELVPPFPPGAGGAVLLAYEGRSIRQSGSALVYVTTGAGCSSSSSRNDSTAWLNRLRLRCTMPTGRTNSGACIGIETSRPCAISACIVRAGRMLMPEPSATASLII